MFINIPNGETKAGVALNFDDSVYAGGWLSYHTNFGAAKSWKATFNVYTTAVPQELTDIGALVTAGHELGNHASDGATIINQIDPTYSDLEFKTMVEGVDDWMFAQFGVRSKAYVWPSGDYGQFYVDYMAANSNYTIFRRTANIDLGDILTYIHLYNPNDIHPNQIIGTSLDEKSDADYTNQIEPVLEYCRDNGLIVVFYGHAITESSGDIKRTVLDSICDYVNNNNMKFYTLNDIAP